MAVDFYSTLGVARGASDAEIRNAYRKLAVKLHPDRNPGNAKAEERFKQVNQAWSVLSDKKRRALYDEFGEEGLRDGFDVDMARAYGSRRRSGYPSEAPDAGGFGGFGGPGGFGGGSVSDLFGDLFGGRRAGAKRKGTDLTSEVTVGFLDAIKGTTRVFRDQQTGGEVNIRIPPGAADGDKLRVGGRGLPSMLGGGAGDLVITVRVEGHPFLEREGLDLKMEVPLDLDEAYVGGKVRLPTPAGEVTVTVPAGTQSGQTLRLRGRGVQRGERTGDLYLRFLVHYRPGASAELEQAVSQLGGRGEMLRSNLKL